jgi:hypothetical protein
MVYYFVVEDHFVLVVHFVVAINYFKLRFLNKMTSLPVCYDYYSYCYYYCYIPVAVP